jgi:ribose transport system permease protein
VAIVLVGGIILARTVFGRSVYAIGGNPEAARLSGLRVDLVKPTTYVISGALAALAGALLASRTGVGQAELGGSVTLDSIAIVIIGGTSLFGGEGAIWRTVVGILILAMLENLFISLNIEASVQELAKGLVLIAAVSVDAFTRSRRA